MAYQYWVCGLCGEHFVSQVTAEKCEESHIKSETPDVTVAQVLVSRLHPWNGVCSYCKNAYFAYGCEWGCALYDNLECEDHKRFVANDKVLKFKEKTIKRYR